MSYQNPAFGQPPRPDSVNRSFQLWILALVIGVVSAILGFFEFEAAREELIDELVAAGDQISREQAETLVTVSNYVAVGFYLALLGLILGFVFLMRSGKNWARIVLTVVGVISVLLSLLSVAGGGLGSILQLVSAGVVITAIVFMYRRDAAPYFKPAQHY